jgi:hypothetical protein
MLFYNEIYLINCCNGFFRLCKERITFCTVIKFYKLILVKKEKIKKERKEKMKNEKRKASKEKIECQQSVF